MGGVAIQYQLINNYFDSNMVPLASLWIIFLKYIRYRLLLVSFIKPAS